MTVDLIFLHPYGLFMTYVPWWVDIHLRDVTDPLRWEAAIMLLAKANAYCQPEN